MADKYSKNDRILHIYQALCGGETVNKCEAARHFQVDERSIQRDIDDIRSFLSDLAAHDPRETREIIYDRQEKGFVLRGCQPSQMTGSELLAVSKILLESRAFTRQEMFTIIDKLVLGCFPQKNLPLVADLISNEKYNYIELNSPVSIHDKLWDIGSSIQKHHLLEIWYDSQQDGTPPVVRVVVPLSVLFHEYYFYLNAYIVGEEKGEFLPKYDYPTLFRIDCIHSYRLLDQPVPSLRINRFEEREFRKRVQFMYTGHLERIRFRYTGYNVDGILDRLPTAEIVGQSDDSYIIEAEVYGRGIVIWLLSQGEKLEVLAPRSLRREMRDTLYNTLMLYQSDD